MWIHYIRKIYVHGLELISGLRKDALDNSQRAFFAQEVQSFYEIKFRKFWPKESEDLILKSITLSTEKYFLFFQVRGQVYEAIWNETTDYI